MRQVNWLKRTETTFQIISTANSRPFPLRFSSGVSVVQKLNVGFANTVYFTEIQHYKQQATPTPPLPNPSLPPPVLLGADHAMQSEQWCGPILWREIWERWNLPAPWPACPAHTHACPLCRPPESVWAQCMLDQLHGFSPGLQFLHVFIFLFLLLGGFWWQGYRGNIW